MLRERPGGLTATGVRMERLAFFLMLLQNCPVIDKTRLTGSYDFSLEWQPDEPLAPASAEAGRRPEPAILGASSSLPAALKQQLGLQLVNAHESVKVLVIDHIEKPSEN